MKKIIALALASLPLVAMAEVNVYGKVKMGLEYDKMDGYKAATRIDDYGTRVGFKGGEALGNGLKAIWQAELGLGLDASKGIKSDSGDLNAYQTDGTRFYAALRDSFIGLDTGFGTVRFGRLSNVFNDNNGHFGLVDNWESGNGVNGLQSYSRYNKRINNSVRYDSPNFSGFTFAAQYGLDENYLLDSSTSTAKRAPVMGLALGYKHDMGIFVDGAYEASRGFSNTDKTGNHWKVEAGYDANNILAVVGYQQGKDNRFYAGDFSAENLGLPAGSSIPTNLKSKEAALTLGYRFGALMPKITYAKGYAVKASDLTLGDDEKELLKSTAYDQFIVGADYNLSKRTVAGVAYGQQKFKNDGPKERTFGVNLVHSF